MPNDALQPTTPPMGLDEGSHGVLLLVARVLCAPALVAAGMAKLAGAPAMVEVFELSGVEQRMRHLVGATEVVFGMSLLVPGLAVWAAVPLLVTMAGAVFAHLFLAGGSAASAVILATPLAFIILSRLWRAAWPPRLFGAARGAEPVTRRWAWKHVSWKGRR